MLRSSAHPPARRSSDANALGITWVVFLRDVSPNRNISGWPPPRCGNLAQCIRRGSEAPMIFWVEKQVPKSKLWVVKQAKLCLLNHVQSQFLLKSPVCGEKKRTFRWWETPLLSSARTSVSAVGHPNSPRKASLASRGSEVESHEFS